MTTAPRPARGPRNVAGHTDDARCTCELSDGESVSYVEYAIGRVESEKMLAEDRDQCPVHSRIESAAAH